MPAILWIGQLPNLKGGLVLVLNNANYKLGPVKYITKNNNFELRSSFEKQKKINFYL